MARHKKNQNPEIAATMLKGSEPVESLPRQRDQLDRVEMLGLSAVIAEDTVCNRNWPWRNARKHFETEPLMRTVDKFYPWAKEGPLYVDEPETEGDEKNCARKRAALESEGCRYIVITKDMTEEQARAQLKG